MQFSNRMVNQVDRRQVNEENLVERYVRNQLSEEQANAFEEFFLNDEQTRNDVESMLMLVRGLEMDESRLARSPSVESSSKSMPALGLAASAVIFSMLGYFLAQSQFASPSGAMEQSLFIPGAMRNDEQRSVGELCAQRSAAIALPVPVDTDYEIRLVRGAKTYQLFQALPAIQTPTGTEVGIFVSPGTLEGGENRLELIEQASGDTVTIAHFAVDPSC